MQMRFLTSEESSDLVPPVAAAWACSARRIRSSCDLGPTKVPAIVQFYGG